MNRDDREISNFIHRVKPSVRYFYRAAYAITADRQMAEYALESALTTAYLHGDGSGGSLSFRDGILAIIRDEALSQLAKGASEDEWDGLTPADPAQNDRINELILGERLDVQRLMVLRYGCAMTPREIASLVGSTVQQVQDELNRCRLHIERVTAAEKQPVHPFDKNALRSIRRAMNRERQNQIDVSAILTSFENELKGRRRSRRILMSVIRGVLFVFIALLCAAILWLVAVLMEM